MLSFFFFQKNITKMPSAKVRETRFDVSGDREKHMGTRTKKVRKQQAGVIDSTTVLALFPQLAVVGVLVQSRGHALFFCLFLVCC